MEKIYPDSSMISSYGYDPDTETLEISFKTGGTYTYHNVPESVFEDMQAAPSVGRFFLSDIKGRY